MDCAGVGRLRGSNEARSCRCGQGVEALETVMRKEGTRHGKSCKSFLPLQVPQGFEQQLSSFAGKGVKGCIGKLQRKKQDKN